MFRLMFLRLQALERSPDDAESLSGYGALLRDGGGDHVQFAQVISFSVGAYDPAIGKIVWGHTTLRWATP